MVLTVQHLELLRGLEQDDFMDMELEDLERISQFCDIAFSIKKKQHIEELRNQKIELEKQKQKLLEFEPKIKELFASKPIKFNVSGSYFFISLHNLTKEPNTYFAVLFGGRWNPLFDPTDDAVYIDRDPTMFGMILNYMRTGNINLKDLTQGQFEILKEEVDFYQIGSLLELFALRHEGFSSEVKGYIVLSNNNLVATYLCSERAFAYAISSEPFSATRLEMNVKLVKGNLIMIGVSTREILQPGKDYDTCGWHMYCNNGALYSQSGDRYKPFMEGGIQVGSVVTVRLDYAFNISFAVDGVDQGIAFKAVVKDDSNPLYLAVGSDYKGASIEMM